MAISEGDLGLMMLIIAVVSIGITQKQYLFIGYVGLCVVLAAITTLVLNALSDNEAIM